jgi:DNA-binding transcriptional ArsR family regulator
MLANHQFVKETSVSVRDVDNLGCVMVSANEMGARAAAAAQFLKALSHEGRLMILCHLSSGEKTVTMLEDLLGARQAAVSQQLARLRNEGLVAARRDGKAIFYSIKDPKAATIMALVYQMFCGPNAAI